MSLEPAIPPHLREERTQPLRGDPDFMPKTPSYSARYDEDLKDFGIIFVGVQFLDEKEADALIASISANMKMASGPDFLDKARFTDRRGYHNVIFAAYWKGKAASQAWMHSMPDNWWRKGLTEGGPVGAFVEILTPGIRDFETSYSHPVPEGIAHLAPTMSRPTDSHEYWGSARDRMPRAQTDDLAPKGKPVLVDLGGGLVRVQPHENLSLIRSGQDWEDTKDKERTYYLNGIAPALAKGMKEIEEDGLPLGCYFNRVLALECTSGEKTYSLSAWHSHAQLEAWVQTETHLAIFRSRTTEYAKVMGDEGAASNIRLGHEIMVLKASDQEFLYFNCHDDTGMLRAGKMQ